MIPDPTLNYPITAKPPKPPSCEDPPYEPKPPYTYAQRADMEGWSLQKRMENAPESTAVGMTDKTRSYGMCMRCLSSSIPVKVDKKEGLVYCAKCYDDPDRKPEDCRYMFQKDKVWTFFGQNPMDAQAYEPLGR